MLNKLRNFSKGKLAGVLVGIIIIPFVFWGMGSVFSGGNTNIDNELSEDDLYNLELEAFMRLIQMPKTQERIKHTLETGKPLVN